MEHDFLLYEVIFFLIYLVGSLMDFSGAGKSPAMAGY